MNAITRVFGWLGRKAVLYVLLVLAIAAATVVVPWLRQVVTGATSAQVRATTLDEAVRQITRERDAALEAFKVRAASLKTASVAELDRRKGELVAERATLQQQIDSARPAWMLAVTDQSELIANEQRKLRVAVIEQELPVIAAARNIAASNGGLLSLQQSIAQAIHDRNKSVIACANATRQRQTHESQWVWWIEFPESQRHKDLVKAEKYHCGARDAATKRIERLRADQSSARAARQALDATFADAANASDFFKSVGRDLAADADKARTEYAGTLVAKFWLWLEKFGLLAILGNAAIALALIIAMPFLIRLFCYFVLAPIAMRRPSIRLRVPEGGGVAIAPAARSAVSVTVRLAAGEELLVRQDYLQTTSHGGAKGTQWWLDWRMPFMSIATGLTFLTRIRGTDEITTISATRDGLAEVTVLTLPDGAACVLQPRALAAVVQPIERPLRITRHWRLGSLNAWLTLQLRYLVFHGPARLVLKGGRGVRVEPAEGGRVFGQDQLVGFSADLAYSVTRAETFWPYFLGREQLLKDRVLGGQGVLIVEEAPLSARRGEVRRGIEGMIDAGMKVLGM